MKIYKAKNGRRYIKLKSGRAKFIKNTFSSKKKATRTKTYSTRRGVKVAKRKASKRKSSGFFGNLNKPIIGAVGVIAYESFISPAIPLQGVTKDLVELMGGLYLQKKKGAIGAVGKTLVTLNAYQLARNLIGDSMLGFNLGGASSASGNYGGY